MEASSARSDHLRARLGWTREPRGDCHLRTSASRHAGRSRADAARRV